MSSAACGKDKDFRVVVVSRIAGQGLGFRRGGAAVRIPQFWGRRGEWQDVAVGILGAGWAGESHAAAYSRLPGVEVTGLWNRTKMRAEALAGRLGYADLTVYDDWQSLISAGNCDVISIATAPMLRSDPLWRPWIRVAMFWWRSR